MKILFVAFFLALNVGFTSATTSPYFETIYSAEKCILQSDYCSALDSYQVAFIKDGFAGDFLNAGFCAFFCNKDSLGIAYIKTYLNRGGAVSNISDSAFKRFFPSLSPAVLQKIRKLKDKYLLTNPIWENEVRLFIDSLIKRDQQNHMAIVGEERCAKIWRENHDLLFRYIRENGFPFEGLIGVDSTSLFVPFGYVLYRHFAQQGMLSTNDLELIRNAVADKKVTPAFYADILELAFKKEFTGSMSVVMVIIDDTLKSIDPGIFKMKDSVLWIYKDINQARLWADSARTALLLDPFDDFVQKQMFQIYNISQNLLPFIFNSTGITAFRVKTKDTYDAIKSMGYIPFRGSYPKHLNELRNN